MNKTFTRVAALGLATFLLAQVPVAVSAYGPARDTYTLKNPARQAVFNSITDNPAVGDERDFVRVAEKRADGSDTYRSNIEVEGEKEYEVYIYYHNDASATFNDAAHNYVGVARDTRLSSSFPTKLAKGEKGTIMGKISSSSTNPAAVWDEAYITAKEDITLHYVTGSAKIYNGWDTNGSVLSTRLFTNDGTLLGTSQLNGVIPGCNEYSGQVVYTIVTHRVTENTPDPDPEPEPEPEPDPEIPEVPEEPETPEELPTTGPAEIALAVVVVLAIGAGGFYWYRTQKAVSRVTRRAKGKK